MNERALEPPRWKNGPYICIAVNLPAFEDEKEVKKFQDKNGTICQREPAWHCPSCNGWHYMSSL